MAFALALQCSDQLSYEEPYIGAGQCVEFILTRDRSETENDDVNCGNTYLNGDMIGAVVIAI